jgi:beta-glucosidase
VLINGKPLSVPWIKKYAHAIVEAWNPGCEGGNAIAGILFGDRNPLEPTSKVDPNKHTQII